MKRTATKLLISELLNSKIVTAEGKIIGHVADIQLTPAPEYKVIALLFGLHGWFYRLHFLNPFQRIKEQQSVMDSIPWDAIESFESSTVKLKPGYNKTNLKSASPLSRK